MCHLHCHRPLQAVLTSELSHHSSISARSAFWLLAQTKQDLSNIPPCDVCTPVDCCNPFVLLVSYTQAMTMTMMAKKRGEVLYSESERWVLLEEKWAPGSPAVPLFCTCTAKCCCLNCIAQVGTCQKHCIAQALNKYCIELHMFTCTGLLS